MYKFKLTLNLTHFITKAMPIIYYQLTSVEVLHKLTENDTCSTSHTGSPYVNAFRGGHTHTLASWIEAISRN